MQRILEIYHEIKVTRRKVKFLKMWPYVNTRVPTLSMLSMNDQDIKEFAH